MIARQRLALSALLLAFLPVVLGTDASGQVEARDVHQKRAYDSYKVYERSRNAHACIMSIVFIVLYPLGAISIHLPIHRIPLLKNTYLKNKVSAIHRPIQLIGLVMMIGGMGLGIRIAQNLGYLGSPVHAHVVIGLLVACIIIVVQPVLGGLQHQYYKKTGRTGAFGYIHRWVGRGAILLGIVNDGLGFKLASNTDINVSTSTYLKNFSLAGVLGLIWIGLIAYGMFRPSPRTQHSSKDDEFTDEVSLVDQRKV